MIEIEEERLKNLSDYNIPNAGLSDEEIIQILQDHEKARTLDDMNKYWPLTDISSIIKKARKWDESLLGSMLERDEITVGDYMQNIKLKELIEKEITWSNKNALLSEDKRKKDFFNFLSEALTSLLEDSKK